MVYLQRSAVVLAGGDAAAAGIRQHRPVRLPVASRRADVGRHLRRVDIARCKGTGPRALPLRGFSAGESIDPTQPVPVAHVERQGASPRLSPSVTTTRGWPARRNCNPLRGPKRTPRPAATELRRLHGAGHAEPEDPQRGGKRHWTRAPTVTALEQGSIQSKSSHVVRAAALSGLGIRVSPTWLFEEAVARDDLQVLFPDRPAPTALVHLLIQSQRQQSAKAKAFADHLAGLVVRSVGIRATVA